MSDTTVTTDAPINYNEPAYGRAGLERDAGLVPLPDESKEEAPPELTKDEAAAERLKQLAGSESTIRTFTSGLPDNVTLTAEQAGKMLADVRGAEKVQAEADDVEIEQNRIDKMREADKPAEPKIETDEDVERVLKSPKVQAAISTKLGEAETQRQHHEAAVAHATNFAVASLFGDVPELADLPTEQWVAAIQNMPPARAQLAYSKLQALGRVEAANQQIHAEKAGRQQAEMKEYTAREQTRYEELINDIPARDQAAIGKHLPKMLAGYGVDVKQFTAAIANQTVFPRSIAQALLVKAARYDLMTKAAKATPTHVIPTVQRPGTPGPRVDRADVNLASLSAKLGKTGSLKDAAALLSARRSKGR